MLTESKYNVSLANTACWWRARLLLSAAAFIIVVMLSEQFEWTLLLCIISLVLFWCYPLRKSQEQSNPEQQIAVTESGRWLPVVDEGADSHEAWQIEGRSKLLPFALYVVMVSELTGRRKRLWIFRKQTSELSYRRLARIIFRQGIL